MQSISIVQRAIVYLEDHLYKSFELEKMAEYIGENTYIINQTFMMLTGYDIERYLNNRRMTEAAYLLRQGNYRLIDIAMKFGYPDAHSFSNAFSDHFNISPIQVRQQFPTQKLLHRLYLKIGVTENKPFSFDIIQKERKNLIGRLYNYSGIDLVDPFVIADTLHSFYHDAKTKKLLNHRSEDYIYIATQLYEQQLKVFIGVASERIYDYDTFVIPNGEYMCIEHRGHIDYCINEIWQSKEQQINLNIDTNLNDVHIYQFKHDINFEHGQNKVVAWFPMQI